ncbi:MAG: hypothetical protein V8R43_11095 [Dorea sp.]
MEYLKREIRTFEKKHIVSSQFYVDDDYNVPDAKRDVGQVILSSGNCRLKRQNR